MSSDCPSKWAIYKLSIEGFHHLFVDWSILSRVVQLMPSDGHDKIPLFNKLSGIQWWIHEALSEPLKEWVPCKVLILSSMSALLYHTLLLLVEVFHYLWEPASLLPFLILIYDCLQLHLLLFHVLLCQIVPVNLRFRRQRDWNFLRVPSLLDLVIDLFFICLWRHDLVVQLISSSSSSTLLQATYHSLLLLFLLLLRLSCM